MPYTPWVLLRILIPGHWFTTDDQCRCQVCRARQTKCDNAKPSCSYCLNVGASCIQSPFDLSSFDPASLRILERLDELEHLLRERPGASEQPDALHRNAAPTKLRMLDDNRDEHLHLKDAMQSPETTASASEICIPSLRSLLPERLEHILAWTAASEFSGLSCPDTISPVAPCHSSPGKGEWYINRVTGRAG